MKKLWYEVSVLVKETSKRKARKKAIEFLKDKNFPIKIRLDEFLNKKE